MTYSHSLARDRLRQLSRRRNTPGFVYIIWHVAIALGTGWLVLVTAGTYWVLPATIVHGVALVFLFCAEHEAIHFTAFRTRALNWTVASAAGLLLMLPPAWFRCFHLAHHRWTQDPARDPELATPKPQSLRQYLWWISGIPYWRDRLTKTALHALGRVDDAYVPARSRPLIVREARLFWAVYAGLLVVAVALPLWRELLLLWILPVIAGQPFLRLYLLAEHTGCPYISDMLINSRTVLTNAFVRRLAWNMPYHVEHHAYPGTPFHALPRLHDEIVPRIAHIEGGYFALHSRLLGELMSRR